jgi:hypothetical protein
MPPATRDCAAAAGPGRQTPRDGLDKQGPVGVGIGLNRFVLAEIGIVSPFGRGPSVGPFGGREVGFGEQGRDDVFGFEFGADVGMPGCLGGLEERLEDAVGGLLGGREFGLGLDLVHGALTGRAVGEVFDDRVSRVRNACGAKFVREFFERGLVK